MGWGSKGVDNQTVNAKYSEVGRIFRGVGYWWGKTGLRT